MFCQQDVYPRNSPAWSIGICDRTLAPQEDFYAQLIPFALWVSCLQRENLWPTEVQS